MTWRSSTRRTCGVVMPSRWPWERRSRASAAAAFWASQNLQPAQPVLWAGVSLAAALIAAKLGFTATKQWRELNRLHIERTALAARHPRLLQRKTRRGGGGARRDGGRQQRTAGANARQEAGTLRARSRARTAAQGRLHRPGDSQILIARETGAASSAGLGSGVVTGVLNNLGAVAAHARNIIPGLKADLAHLLDGEASAAARLGAAVTLVLKAAVIAVLAYVVSLEFSQLQSMVAKTKAEACSARMSMIANTLSPSEWPEANAQYEKDCGV